MSIVGEEMGDSGSEEGERVTASVTGMIRALHLEVS